MYIYEVVLSELSLFTALFSTIKKKAINSNSLLYSGEGVYTLLFYSFGVFFQTRPSCTIDPTNGCDVKLCWKVLWCFWLSPGCSCARSLRQYWEVMGTYVFCIASCCCGKCHAHKQLDEERVYLPSGHSPSLRETRPGSQVRIWRQEPRRKTAEWPMN